MHFTGNDLQFIIVLRLAINAVVQIEVCFHFQFLLIMQTISLSPMLLVSSVTARINNNSFIIFTYGKFSVFQLLASFHEHYLTYIIGIISSVYFSQRMICMRQEAVHQCCVVSSSRAHPCGGSAHWTSFAPDGLLSFQCGQILENN